MLATTLACPRCQSTHVVKNGRIHNGRQNFKLLALAAGSLSSIRRKRRSDRRLEI